MREQFGMAASAEAPKNNLRNEIMLLVSRSATLADMLDAIDSQVFRPRPQPAQGGMSVSPADHVPAVETSIADLASRIEAAISKADGILSRL